MDYTERMRGFKIRDVKYLGLPPKDAPIEFDIVKWEKTEPREVDALFFDSMGRPYIEKKISTEYCYSVAQLEWNDREPCFEFRSVGLRWLEAKAPPIVVDMIIDFCRKKEKEILEKEDRLNIEDPANEL